MDKILEYECTTLIRKSGNLDGFIILLNIKSLQKHFLDDFTSESYQPFEEQMISRLYDCLQRTEKEETFSSLSETIIKTRTEYGRNIKDKLREITEILKKTLKLKPAF